MTTTEQAIELAQNLIEELKKANVENGNLHDRINSLKDEILDLNYDIRLLKCDLKDAEDEKNRLEDEVDNLNSEVGDVKTYLKKVEDERDDY